MRVNWVALSISLALAVGLVSCDTVNPTRTGTVTSLSASTLCLNPEDPKQPPGCFEVGNPGTVQNIQVGACVKIQSSPDEKLLRAEALDRACRNPQRS
jgi:hypothetical protein